MLPYPIPYVPHVDRLDRVTEGHPANLILGDLLTYNLR